VYYYGPGSTPPPPPIFLIYYGNGVGLLTIKNCSVEKGRIQGEEIQVNQETQEESNQKLR
jgi:hypothetical protein